MRRLLLLALILSVAGCAVRRADQPEPPPQEVRGRGMPPGWHEAIKTEDEIDRLCRAWGVDANDAWVRRKIQACVIPSLKAVILPPNASPELRAHEQGHSWGYQHNEGGRGWVKAPNVFSRQPTQTGATTNVFRTR